MKKDLFKRFFPSSVHIVMSAASDGSMGLSSEQNKEKLQSRNTFLKQASIPSGRLVIPRMAHGTIVLPVTRPDAVTADGLVTREKNLYLAITVADCLPIFLFDPEHEAIGIIHAGWRGIVGGIIPNAFAQLADQHDCDPSKLLVGIGPSIGPCHYEAKPGVADQFRKFRTNVLIKHDDKQFIDLREAVIEQLTDNGVQRQNIQVIDECTYEHPDKYFSWRREQPGELKTMLAVVGLN